jgi:hypothetical protein
MKKADPAAQAPMIHSRPPYHLAGRAVRPMRLLGHAAEHRSGDRHHRRNFVAQARREHPHPHDLLSQGGSSRAEEEREQDRGARAWLHQLPSPR